MKEGFFSFCKYFEAAYSLVFVSTVKFAHKGNISAQEKVYFRGLSRILYYIFLNDPKLC